MLVGQKEQYFQTINLFSVTEKYVVNILSYGLGKIVGLYFSLFHFYSLSIRLWKDKFSQQHFKKISQILKWYNFIIKCNIKSLFSIFLFFMYHFPMNHFISTVSYFNIFYVSFLCIIFVYLLCLYFHIFIIFDIQSGSQVKIRFSQISVFCKSIVRLLSP